MLSTSTVQRRSNVRSLGFHTWSPWCYKRLPAPLKLLCLFGRTHTYNHSGDDCITQRPGNRDLARRAVVTPSGANTASLHGPIIQHCPSSPVIALSLYALRDLSWKTTIDRYPLEGGHARNGRHRDRYVNNCKSNDPRTIECGHCRRCPQAGPGPDYLNLSSRDHEKLCFPESKRRQPGSYSVEHFRQCKEILP